MPLGHGSLAQSVITLPSNNGMGAAVRTLKRSPAGPEGKKSARPVAPYNTGCLPRITWAPGLTPQQLAVGNQDDPAPFMGFAGA